MKKILLVMFVVVLMGCDAKTVDTSSRYVLPAELSDCKFYYIQGEGLSQTLHVVRCPNSSTSTTWNEQQGKSAVTKSATVIDGE